MNTSYVALVLVLIGTIVMVVRAIQERHRDHRRDRLLAQVLSGEVGRTAEEGTAIHVALGHGNLLTEDGMASVAALETISDLTVLAAAYSTPPTISTGDATLYLLAATRLRDAYAQLGDIEACPLDAVQFVAPTPLLYAGMAATLTRDHTTGASLILGSLGQEASLLVDAARQRGARTYGGTHTAVGSAAFYPELDSQHLLIGEQLFSEGARVQAKPIHWASLTAQDTLRWLIVAGVAVTALLSLLKGIGG